MSRQPTIMMILLFLLLSTSTIHAQDDAPLVLPFTTPPGPDSWLVGQFYGNTIDAYTYRREWYSAGQGLHFGLDLYAPCGTPVVAVADGQVHAVDAPSFGADPHNVVLIHPQIGFSTVYGHLLETSLLVEGQPIKRGDWVGIVGDADGVCTSRPHLHFELRSLDFGTAYNPVNFIDAPWHTLSTIGPLTTPQFQRDLDNPSRWMSIDDQPSVNFGEPYLNNYQHSLPLGGSAWPSLNTPPLPRTLPPLDAESTWQLQQVTQDGCCAFAWWHPTDSTRFYTIEANASLVERDVSGSAAVVGEASAERRSSDGTFRAFRAAEGMVVEDVSAQTRWRVNTDGVVPSISADNSRLLWQVADYVLVPGEDYPTVEIFTSKIDGSQPRRLWQQAGGETVWLDATRVLIVTPELDSSKTTLTIYDTATDQSYELGTWNWLRGLDVGPGGTRIMFYLMWQADPAQNGVYTLLTQAGATAEQLPWFGAWRWRDSDSVYYLPFTIGWHNADKQVLAYYNMATQVTRHVTNINTMPLTIDSNDWAVSPDGSRILFRSAVDHELWLLVEEP